MDPNNVKILPALVLRNLGDRSYEKRKQAALEIEHIIKDCSGKENGEEQISKIINVLVSDFVYSSQSNNRKGGLIGLAASAIALMDNTSKYLNSSLPSVLKCFEDQESRVRYYACEALYNITKVARGHVLQFFNEIFDGLCKLYADVDNDVKNGAQLLDRLIKDVVTESETFDVEKFIPLLKERILIKNPYIRQLLVGWITVLDSVPYIDMLEYLPEYLSGLFDMLSDPSRDIRQQAYATLAELLRETTQCADVNLGPMVIILVEHCDSKDSFTRLTVLTWMFEFIQLGQVKLLSYSADLLGSALNCIADPEKEIRKKASNTNDSLLELIQSTNETIDIHPLLNRVTLQLLNKFVPSRLASLAWISMLLRKMPEEVFSFLDELFPALLKTLHDDDDQVVRLDLEVLARISLDKTGTLNQTNFKMVLNHLMKRFSADRKFLESRGSFIIRQLCVLLNGESIYRTLSDILLKTDDLEFASLMVQTLNLILLTAPELFQFRSLLKKCFILKEANDLFVVLFSSWAHNPISTFSLCLLAQAYELSSALVFRIADIEVTIGFLMQIDKLVQLLESPIFIHLRLQLLQTKAYPFLLQSLYGLMMLLPQSNAFTSLKNRLSSVASLAQAGVPSSHFVVAEPEKKIYELDFGKLLNIFQETQKKHSMHREKIFQEASLIISNNSNDNNINNNDTKTDNQDESKSEK